jgi:hypothetical protein
MSQWVYLQMGIGNGARKSSRSCWPSLPQHSPMLTRVTTPKPPLALSAQKAISYPLFRPGLRGLANHHASFGSAIRVLHGYNPRSDAAVTGQGLVHKVEGVGVVPYTGSGSTHGEGVPVGTHCRAAPAGLVLSTSWLTQLSRSRSACVVVPSP